MNIKRIKYGCYTTSLSMSVVGNLSPVLFVTFHNVYNISFSLLGLLVLINFCTQLLMDLVFSFMSYKFNIEKTIKFTPILTLLGLVLYAAIPTISPKFCYLGLVISTVLLAASSGLCEVLTSPTIASISGDNTEKELSKLHSVYAFGVVGMIIVSTLFLYVFGEKNWQFLPLIFCLIPISSVILFLGTHIPLQSSQKSAKETFSFLKNTKIWLCVISIFLAGAIECTMAQWASSYLEVAMSVPKIWGDIFGVALFGLMLGIGRALYGKRGGNISKVLLGCSILAVVCYFFAATTNIPQVAVVACAMTGLAASMMWPGSLLLAEKYLPTGGVLMYGIMASGGDLGASFGPQLTGVIIDYAPKLNFTKKLAELFGVSADIMGMKLGIFLGFIFSLIAVIIFIFNLRLAKRTSDGKKE